MTDTSTLDHLIDKAGVALDAVGHAISEHAPQAWALAVQGVYAKGLSSLVVGGICFGIFLLLVLFAMFMFWRGSVVYKAVPHDNDTPLIWFFPGVAALFVAIVFLIATAANVLDSDSWARVISPQGYLAQQIINGVAGNHDKDN